LELGPSLVKILEEAAFVFTSVISGPQTHTDDTLFLAELKIGTDPSIHLLLATSPRFSEELTANMLGIEPGDVQAKTLAADAMRELVNVVGGLLIERWFGHSSTLAITVPEVASATLSQLLTRVGAEQVTTLVAMSGEHLYIAAVEETRAA